MRFNVPVNELQAGDTVKLTVNRYNLPMPALVERVTKTQVLLEDGQRFHRTNGREVGGDDWGAAYIESFKDEQAYKELFNKIYEHHLRFYIEHVRWVALPIAVVEKCMELVNPALVAEQQKLKEEGVIKPLSATRMCLG